MALKALAGFEILQSTELRFCEEKMPIFSYTRVKWRGCANEFCSQNRNCSTTFCAEVCISLVPGKKYYTRKEGIFCMSSEISYEQIFYHIFD